MAIDMSWQARTFDPPILVSCADIGTSVVAYVVVPYAEKPEKFTRQI